MEALQSASIEIDVFPRTLRIDIGNRHPNMVQMQLSDPKRWTYAAQQYAMLLTLERNRYALFSTAKVRVFERSLQTVANVHAPALNTHNLITDTEFEMLMDWHAELSIHDAVKPDVIVYLRKDPQRCLESFRQALGENNVGMFTKVSRVLMVNSNICT